MVVPKDRTRPAPPEPPTTSGVTAPAGFRAAGVRCGIRRSDLDLAVLVSETEASAAAVFTRNVVRAAPIQWSVRAIEKSGGRARAIVINSGNANACTGSDGESAADRTARETARLLGCGAEEVLVASTGVIGKKLPVERLTAALPGAIGRLSRDEGDAVAKAILTTDTCTKQSVRRVTEKNCRFVVGGMAKGSGMVHPDMATTLAFVTTDAAVEPSVLQAMLRRACDRSFNRITVDGDTSTNDMIAVLANGQAGTDASGGACAELFERALTEVLVDLARAVARDGEGATRLITVRVTGATSETDALEIARTVSGSPLVKTAVHGCDANWGRIVAAAGRAGVDFRPELMALRINGLQVLAPGFVSEFSEEDATRRLSLDEVVLELDLGAGAAEATAWTCDLTKEYIEINAHYRT